MTYNKNATRYYSERQEKVVAKRIKGKCVPNSGAIRFGAGDVTTDEWLIECKTKTSECSSFSIKKEWLEKNKEEMFAMGKSYSALAFDFGDGNNYYVLDEKTFLMLKEMLDNNGQKVYSNQ